MLTINIEKELAHQTVSDIAKAEKVLRQANTTLEKASKDDQRLLELAGLSGASGAVHSAKYEILNHRQMIEGHAYHIEQIKALCYKYHLRFLPSFYFRGPVDPGVIEKIRAIEKEILPQNNYHLLFWLDPTFHIMAPASAFELGARPVDPLLFFRIPDTPYHRLIHQWGNDMSIFRAILGLLNRPFADLNWDNHYSM